LVDVEERYRNYLTFLHELYGKVEGCEIPLVSMWEIGEKIGTGGPSSAETVNIVNWLIGEGLIKWRSNGGIIGLTHCGIREVEDARRNPNAYTEHFSPNTINNMTNNYGTPCIIRPYNKVLAILIRQLRLLNSNMRVLLKLSGR
jgi:hypothetical protein